MGIFRFLGLSKAVLIVSHSMPKWRADGSLCRANGIHIEDSPAGEDINQKNGFVDLFRDYVGLWT